MASIRWIRKGFSTSTVAALLVAGLCLATPAQASLIGLTPTPPDITATILDLAGSAKTGSGLLGVDPGASLNLNALALLSLNSAPFAIGSYYLSYGGASPSNSFVLLDLSTNSTLLAGNITKAGDQITPDVNGDIESFDFIVKITQVDPALASAGFTTWAGITLGPAGFFYESDIFSVPVPEPGSFILVALGLLGMAALRRRLN